MENYYLLQRISEGLGIPRSYMGLSWSGDDDDAYPGDEPSGVAEEVDDDMLRRDVLAKGSVALVGVPVLGKLLGASAGPGDLALPSQVGMADVAEIKNTTEQLRVAARTLGGQARAVSAAATQYGRLLQVPASEDVTARLFSQLAELNELAGWCCFDSGMDLHARWYYRTAIDLAQHVNDRYHVVNALRLVGSIDRARGRPNDALKNYQLGMVNPFDATLTAWLHEQSALAMADLGHPEQAITGLAKARDGWEPPDKYTLADRNFQTALVYMSLGKLEPAEQFASAVNGSGLNRPVGVLATVLRATIYVQAGESRALLMAKSAIDGVAPLHSVRARERLQPLAAALEARAGSGYQDLARIARQVSTVL